MRVVKESIKSHFESVHIMVQFTYQAVGYQGFIEAAMQYVAMHDVSFDDAIEILSEQEHGEH